MDLAGAIAGKAAGRLYQEPTEVDELPPGDGAAGKTCMRGVELGEVIDHGEGIDRNGGHVDERAIGTYDKPVTAR
jgi:hypothetical protein